MTRLVCVMFIMTAFAPGSLFAQAKEPEREEIKLTETEAKFLAKLTADYKEAWDSLVVLFGIAEVAGLPKPTGDLAKFTEEFGKLLAGEAIKAQTKPPTIDETFKNIDKVLRRNMSQEVQLFIIGKHADHKDYKPTGKNKQFFIALVEGLHKE